MDKPLPDWTLRDARAYCRAQHCDDCQMHGDDSWSCKLNNPTNWDLSGWSRYTPDEIALARLLMEAGAIRVKLVSGQDPEALIDYRLGANMGRGTLPGAAFLSLPTDKWVDLKDIAESE